MNCKVIAVTGGIACGKSTVARFLSELDCDILDTDDLSHDLQGPRGEAVEAIAERFGPDAIALDGAVNRRVLGRLVFSDPAARIALEEIMHPLIWAEVEKWISTRADGTRNAVLIPLLFEAGFDRKFPWEATVAVVSSKEAQLRRLANRGIVGAEAEARIAAQMPCEEKSQRATFSIVNNGSMELLKAETRKVFDMVFRIRNGE